jgi:hypothetical protein
MRVSTAAGSATNVKAGLVTNRRTDVALLADQFG